MLETKMSFSANLFSCVVVVAFSVGNGQLYPDIPDTDKPWGTPTVQQLQQDLQECRRSFAMLKSVLDNFLSSGEAEWSDWGAFSDCSIDCIPITGNATGTRTRTRTCENPADIFGMGGGCPGEGTETVRCAPDELCPVSVRTPLPQEKIGGSGGWPFTDDDEWDEEPITAVRMTCGRVAVSLQFRYGDDWGPVHGGGESIWCEFPPTYNVTYTFSPGERIVAANATFNSYTNSLSFFTNMGAIQKCGTTTGSNVKSLQGRRLLYVSGSAGCYIDGLALHWAQ